MVDKVAIYKEEKMSLSPVAFVRDVVNQSSILDLSSYELSKQLGLLWAYQTKAYHIKEEITEIDKREIKELILSRFKRLSMNELYYAFKIHRMGEICQEIKPFGVISVSFVSKILTSYVEWKRNVRAKNNLPLSESTDNKEVSDEEKKKYIISGTLRTYDQYKEHKVLPSGSLYVYDVLYDIDLLPKDPESKRKYYQRAKESVRMQLELEKKGIGIDLRRIREIKDIVESIHKKGSEPVVAQAKKDVICDYFKTVKREELEKILQERV